MEDEPVCGHHEFLYVAVGERAQTQLLVRHRARRQPRGITLALGVDLFDLGLDAGHLFIGMDLGQPLLRRRHVLYDCGRALDRLFQLDVHLVLVVLDAPDVAGGVFSRAPRFLRGVIELVRLPEALHVFHARRLDEPRLLDVIGIELTVRFAGRFERFVLPVPVFVGFREFVLQLVALRRCVAAHRIIVLGREIFDSALEHRLVARLDPVVFAKVGNGRRGGAFGFGL